MRKNSIWDEFERMHREMDKMFADYYGPFSQKALVPKDSNVPVETSNYRQPLADIWETDNEVVATLDMPGVDKSDIDINITEDKLEIKVEKKHEHREEKKGAYRFERSYNGFFRCFALPSNVKSDKADATYNNGVLEIRIPKVKQVKDKGTKINVK